MGKNLIKDLTHTQRVRLLYKTILKLHRGLPAGLKELGDNYTKDEFKRHKKCNPSEANLFMNEWTKYALDISQQLGLRGKPKGNLGKDIDEDTLKGLKDDQIVQLYELMMAAKAEEEAASK